MANGDRKADRMTGYVVDKDRKGGHTSYDWINSRQRPKGRTHSSNRSKLEARSHCCTWSDPVIHVSNLSPSLKSLDPYLFAPYTEAHGLGEILTALRNLHPSYDADDLIQKSSSILYHSILWHWCHHPRTSPPLAGPNCHSLRHSPVTWRLVTILLP